MRWLTKLLLRSRSLLRGGKVEGELQDEIQFHIEQQIAENQSAGMTPQDARAAALRSLGSVTHIRQECRDVRGLHFVDNLYQDLRYALRVLGKNPGFAAVAVTTLALGIGANTAAFSLVNAVLLRPLPLPSGERVALIQVESALADDTGRRASPAQFLAWRQDRSAFDLLAAAAERRGQITGFGDAEEVQALQVSQEFLELAGVQPLVGRSFGEEDFSSGTMRVCLISENLWHRGFAGDHDAIGLTIELDAEPVRIIGVLPGTVAFPNTETDVWTVLQFSPDRQRQRFLDVYGRLRPGVSVQDAQASLGAATAREERELPEWLRARSVTVSRLRELVVSDQETLLIVLSGVALCVLLICCANLSTMLLARHLNRAREMALRASIGATRGRLVRQLLTESLVLCVIGAAGGLAVGRAFLSLGYGLLSNSQFRTLIAQQEEIIDLRVATYTLCLSVFTAILFGLAPSLHFARVDLNAGLKSLPRGRQSGQRGHRLSRYLVAAELAVAFVLLSGAGLLARSFVGLLNVDRGYRIDRLLTARLPRPSGGTTIADRKQLFRQLTERLRGMPDVVAVGFVTGLPLGGLNATVTLQRPGQIVDPQNLPWAAINCVNGDYFKAMGIRVLEGRLFDSTDNETGMRVAIVNDTLARQFWPDREAVGQEIMPGIRIVGVVQDIRQESLDTRQGPSFYLPFDQREALAASPNFILVRTSGEPRAFASVLKEVVRSINPSQPVMDIRTMEEVLSRSVNHNRLLASLMGCFALLAVILSIAGIYGVLSYVVNSRTREIGIRVVLGAQKWEILRLLGKQLFTAVAVGVPVGLAVTLMVSRILTQWLFAIQANDPLTLLTAAAITSVVALLGAMAPATRALRIDPMAAVRVE